MLRNIGILALGACLIVAGAGWQILGGADAQPVAVTAFDDAIDPNMASDDLAAAWRHASALASERQHLGADNALAGSPCAPDSTGQVSIETDTTARIVQLAGGADGETTSVVCHGAVAMGLIVTAPGQAPVLVPLEPKPDAPNPRSA
jgi:hypothetical protein